EARNREVLPWRCAEPGRLLPGAADLQRQALQQRPHDLSDDDARIRELHEARSVRSRPARQATRRRMKSAPTRYRRPHPGTQPDYNYPPYASTQKRCPTQPLIVPPQTLSEITGPIFGYDDIKPTDNDLPRKHTGDLIGERTVVASHELDDMSL